MTEFDATFAPREARADALESAADLGPQAGLAALRRLHERGQVLDLADGRQTTLGHRALERATLRAATRSQRTRGRRSMSARRSSGGAAGGRRRGAGRVARAVSRSGRSRLACCDRQLVVIVGQAGTGKSTALQGVARAHEQAGRRIVVASTGAQAAERLAGELREGGCRGAGVFDDRAARERRAGRS